MTPDFDAHLATESDRFLEAVLAADPEATVPSCPEWTSDDLLWHLGTVQAFWAKDLRLRPMSPEEFHRPPDRPGGRRGLRRFFEHATADLREALAAARDDEPAWTWHDLHTAGFIRRRQAHEALIHRLDAELVAGQVTPLPTDLAADGVREVLEWMYAGVPGWATFTPGGVLVAVEPTDVDAPTWVELGRVRGTDPEDGSRLDAPDLALVDPAGRAAAATVRGTADDLDAWLWHRRGAEAVAVTGDEQAYAALAEILRQPIR